MPEFSLADFHNVIHEKHNKNTNKLKEMQKKVKDHAVELVNVFLNIQNFPQAGQWVSYWQNHREQLARCFRNEAPYRGNRTVFDPWNGWWSGNWNSPGQPSSRQRHIWDTTVQQGTQWIQAVTQSTYKYVHGQNLAAAVNPQTGNPKVDLGINVWSPEVGITGWVSKRQYRDEELAHVAFSPNAHTLIWFAQDILQQSGSYFMFFEWISPSRQTCGIYGNTINLLGSNLQPRVTGWTQYQRGAPVRTP